MKKNQGNGRLWRREHREDPINDMWADLSIQGEEKCRPVILECRREWLDGGSENHRTYYILHYTSSYTRRSPCNAFNGGDYLPTGVA